MTTEALTRNRDCLMAAAAGTAERCLRGQSFAEQRGSMKLLLVSFEALPVAIYVREDGRV